MKFPFYVVLWTYDQEGPNGGPGIPYIYKNKEEALEKTYTQALICPSHCHVACYEYEYDDGHPSQGWWTDSIRAHKTKELIHCIFENGKKKK